MARTTRGMVIAVGLEKDKSGGYQKKDGTAVPLAYYYTLHVSRTFEEAPIALRIPQNENGWRRLCDELSLGSLVYVEMSQRIWNGSESWNLHMLEEKEPVEPIPSSMSNHLGQEESV